MDEDTGRQRAKNLDKLMAVRIGGAFEVSRQEGKGLPYVTVSEHIPDLDQALRNAEDAGAWNVRVTYWRPGGTPEICAEGRRGEVGIRWFGLASLWLNATAEDEASVRSQERR